MESKDCMKRLARLRVQLLVLLLVLVGVRGWGQAPSILSMDYPGGSMTIQSSTGSQNVIPAICPGSSLEIDGNDFGPGNPQPSNSSSCNCNPSTLCTKKNNQDVEIHGIYGGAVQLAAVSCWTDGLIKCVLPSSLTPGLAYQLRVKSGSSYSQFIVFTVPSAPGIQYPANQICETQANISPIHTNPSTVFFLLSAPNFSPQPIVDATSGVISNLSLLSNQTSGTITVQCTTTTTCSYPPVQATVVVHKPVATSIAYPSASFCRNTSQSTINCTTSFGNGGTYSLMGAVLQPTWLSQTNGNILSPSSVPLGAHTILYQPNGCYDPSAASITAIDNPIQFSYPFLTICKGAAPMAPNPVEPQGSFTLVSGPGFASVNTNTGEFDPANSPAGVYTVRWSKPTRPCSTFAETTITVIDPGDPTFSYGGFTFCTSDAQNPTTGISSGSFSSPTLPSQFLDPLTGEIDVRDPAFSQFGPHIVINTQNAQGCTLTHQQIINLVEDHETLNYPDFQVCDTDPALYPFGLGSGQGSGSFQSFPAVHPSLDPVSGVITPALITGQDSFRVCWTLSGRTCRDSICTPRFIVVDTTLDASFAYLPQGSNIPQSEFCLTELPVIAGAPVAGGAYLLMGSSPVSLPGNGAFGNLQTVPGTYTMRHALSGACPSTYDLTIDILPTDSIRFAYLNPSTQDTTFCQSDKTASPLFSSAVPMNGLYTYMGQDTGFHVLPNGIIEFENAAADTHRISYYSSTGQCPNTGYASIILFDSPESGFELASFSICEGQDSLLIIADDLLGGDWTWQRDTFSSVPLLPSSTGHIYTGSALPGRYKVTHEISSATCQSTTEQFFTILDYNDTTHIVLDSTGIICAGDQVAFQIDGVKNGNFLILGVSSSGNPLDGITASLAPTLSDTQFVAHYSGYGQCNEFDTLTFQVRAKDATRLAFPDASACENVALAPPSLWAPGQGVFSLSDTSYYRIDPATGSLQQTDPLVNETRISVTYRTDSICPNEASYELTFYPIPKNINLAVTQGDTSCFGTPLNLVASASGAQAFGFVLDGDTTQAISTNAFCDIDSLVVGLRELVVVAKSSRSCINAETFYHLVHPIPYYVEGIPADLTLIQNEQINLDIRTQPSNSVTYWQAVRANYEFVNSRDTGIASPERLLIDGRLVNAYSGADILVYLRPQANGCYGDLDSVLISVQPVDVEVFIPGIITPNGDRFNDAWEIHPKSGFSARNFTMKVFTNQGSLVKRFVLNAEEPTLWSAEEVPDGVYRWMLFDGEGNFYRKGALTILRTPIKAQ